MRDIPHYRQLYNTCGLSSLLMISIPEKNGNLQYLLDDICKLIGVSTEFNRSLNWQLACGYLLLKISFNRILGWHLRKEFGIDYYNFKILLNNQIFQKIQISEAKGDIKKVSALNLFLKRRIIRKKTLRVYMDDMKTNLELKLLAYLFGGRFIPNTNSNDGTGCYTFKKKNKKDLKFINEMIDDGLILGLYNHWMPIKDIYKNDQNSYVLSVNDPLGNQKVIEMNRLTQDHRFYHYKFDPNLRDQMDTIVRRALNLKKNPKIYSENNR
ncbi:MAG: hypothetical protein ACTSPY_14165 [Candidatus Helarchaeota archaeon]